MNLSVKGTDLRVNRYNCIIMQIKMCFGLKYWW